MLVFILFDNLLVLPRETHFPFMGVMKHALLKYINVDFKR